jgi:hypothetical protein
VLHLLLDLRLFSPLLPVYCVFNCSIYMQCAFLKPLSIPFVFIRYVISTELHIDNRFYRRGWQPIALSQYLGGSVCFSLVWFLPFGPSGMGGPTSSYGRALWIVWSTRVPSHHNRQIDKRNNIRTIVVLFPFCIPQRWPTSSETFGTYFCANIIPSMLSVRLVVPISYHSIFPRPLSVSIL